MNKNETKEERIQRITKAKIRLATQKNFWVVNAYTEFAKAYYKVIKQIDEALYHNKDLSYTVSTEMEILAERLFELNDIAKSICRKLSAEYTEPKFLKKLPEVKKVKENKNKQNFFSFLKVKLFNSQKQKEVI